MKMTALILALVLCLPFSLPAQEVTDTTSVVLTQAEFIQLKNDIRTMLVTDSLNLEIIKTQALEISQLRSVIREDSLLISFKDRRILLLEELNTLFENRMLMVSSTPKWYDTRGVWMTVGGTIVIVSSWLFGR